MRDAAEHLDWLDGLKMLIFLLLLIEIVVDSFVLPALPWRGSLLVGGGRLEGHRPSKPTTDRVRQRCCVSSAQLDIFLIT